VTLQLMMRQSVHHGEKEAERFSRNAQALFQKQ
jgi:hypothetical protein